MRSPGIDDGEQFDHITDGTVIRTSIISGNGYRYSLRRPITVHFEKQKRGLWYASIDELMVYGEGRNAKEAYEDLSSAPELLRMTDAEHPYGPMHLIVRTFMGRVPENHQIPLPSTHVPVATDSSCLSMRSTERIPPCPWSQPVGPSHRSGRPS